MKDRFDPEILELIPHREPMLLINTLVSLTANRSETLIKIDDQTPFCTDLGVPAWIGLEYMGQTSALIAGYQEREGLCEPQLGFLMGSRKYASEVTHFPVGQTLRVICEEGALVGSSLANFNCTIGPADAAADQNPDQEKDKVWATATLSVFRRPLSEIESNP